MIAPSSDERNSAEVILYRVLLGLVLINAVLVLWAVLPTVLFLDDFYQTSSYLSDNPFFPRENVIQEMTWGSDWARQLLIHPPLLPAFFWVWNKVGFSGIFLLHVPSLTAICLGCFFWWRIASKIIVPTAINLCIWLVLWWSSFPLLIYCAQAIYAPFECAYLGFACYSLWGKVCGPKKRIAIHLLGCSLFYLYLTFWFIDALRLFIQRRRGFRSNITAFLGVTALIVGWYIRNVAENRLLWDHWMHPSLSTFLAIFKRLFYAVYL